MSALSPRHWSAFAFVLAGVILAGWAWRTAWRPQPLPLESWAIADMADHLCGRGIHLRVVSTAFSSPARQSVFLTQTDKPWARLNEVAALRECIDQWRGTLLLLHRGDDVDRLAEQTELWGDSCLIAGPFVFFGDPELLLSVRAVLGDGAHPGGQVASDRP